MPRRRLKGKVVSDKMEKTVVVVVERVFAHPIYKKRVRVTKRYKAHDEVGAKVGDEVMIEETRPLSKDKRWRVAEIVGKRLAEEPKKVKKPAKAKKEAKRSNVKRRQRGTKQ